MVVVVMVVGPCFLSSYNDNQSSLPLATGERSDAPETPPPSPWLGGNTRAGEDTATVFVVPKLFEPFQRVFFLFCDFSSVAS